MNTTFQLSLLQESKITKTIKTVSIAQLAVSEFNPRYSRTDEDISKLAERISRNGFEITRAIWVYQNGTGYKVFAGGTRLEAARRAGCKMIPVVIHEGLTDEDIVRLADEDNENDEYHAKVSPVDVWAHYAWLADKENGKGWTQEQIARATNVSQKTVSLRLKLNLLPVKIKDFIRQDVLSEGHFEQISQLYVDVYFSPWLTTSQAWEELANKAIYDKGKNGSKSVRSVKDDVDQWREFIAYAENVYQSLSSKMTLYHFDQNPPTPYTFNAQQQFITELNKNSARSLAKVKAAEQAIRSAIADNLRRYQLYIEKQSTEAAQKAMKVELEAELLSRFILGDCCDVLDNWKFEAIRLLLIDPPYGKDYQSNRRWASKAPDKIKGDGEQESMDLLRIAIDKAIPKLDNNAHTLIFCDWRKEPEVRQILEQAGLTVKGSLIWVKEEHSAGDIKGAFGPSHERIVHAVKGSPEVTPRIRDVLEATRSRETNHPNEKPVSLLEKLILSTTNEGDLVVDLFAGCGSTLVAAMRRNRQFVGVEVSSVHHEEGSNRLLKELARNG